jgi:hypothetical protein
MYPILIFMAIGIIIGITIALSMDSWSEKIGFSIINGVLGGLLGSVFGFMVATALPARTVKVKKMIFLECLQDNLGVHGQMYFLGGGYVEGRWQYAYYRKVNGSYFMEHIDTNGVAIRYDSGRPRIEWTEDEAADDKGINKWAIDNADPSPKVIYIPSGSIKNNYNLDAQ